MKTCFFFFWINKNILEQAKLRQKLAAKRKIKREKGLYSINRTIIKKEKVSNIPVAMPIKIENVKPKQRIRQRLRTNNSPLKIGMTKIII